MSGDFGTGPEGRVVHFVVPQGIDDPSRPSGGNVYDRRACTGLAALGWHVAEHAVAGAWPRPGGTARAALAGLLAGLADGAVVLIDGIVALSVPGLARHTRRLRPVILAHMLLSDGNSRIAGTRGTVEAAVLSAEASALWSAAAVVTTSAWTRDRVVERHGLPADRIHVVEPGVDAAGVAPGTADGGALLCLAVVTEAKGHDVLANALIRIKDLNWTAAFAGSLDVDASFTARLRRQLLEGGIADRVQLFGARTGAGLEALYAGADVLVLASRAETYGMVIAEALARGIPVIATQVGGVPEALGLGTSPGVPGPADPGVPVPGLLVPPNDPSSLAIALHRWLDDPALRRALREAALDRRRTLGSWEAAAGKLSEVLAHVAPRQAAPDLVAPDRAAAGRAGRVRAGGAGA